MKRIAAIVIIVLIIAGMWALGKKRLRKPPTRTQAQIQAAIGFPVVAGEITVGDIKETIPVTGDIAALTAVNLSAKAGGRVDSVAVREGDAVKAGQTVIRLDPTDAESMVRSAEARLSQTLAIARAQETQSAAAIQQARAGLDIAQSHLAVIKKGARSQERLVAQNAVNTAKANLDNAEANYKRYETLEKQGAVSAQALETYKTQYDIAKAQYDSASQQLSLIKEGARPEDIDAAESQVKQAREALRMARANASQVAVRREDVKQAQAALTSALQQYDNTFVRAPMSGVVALRAVEPGQTAIPGITLMTVVDLRTVYFEASLSETVFEKIRAGQPVTATVDAMPGQSFVGRVARILPMASTESRNFTARIHIPNPGGRLRPGMFARGEVEVGVKRDALLAPKDAIDERRGDKFIFTVDDGIARMRLVRLGITNTEVAEILQPTDLKAGQRVVVTGHEGLQDGSKVSVRRTVR